MSGWGPLPRPSTEMRAVLLPGTSWPVPVHRRIAPLVAYCFAGQAALGYPALPGQTWGYARRYIRGTRVWSNHSGGRAVDDNSAENPQGASRRHLGTGPISRGEYRIPADVVALWKRVGFSWGGDYRSASPDPMHFEWLMSPEAADAAVAALPRLPTPAGPPAPPAIILPPTTYLTLEDDYVRRRYHLPINVDPATGRGYGDLPGVEPGQVAGVLYEWRDPGLGWEGLPDEAGEPKVTDAHHALPPRGDGSLIPHTARISLTGCHGLPLVSVFVDVDSGIVPA